MALVVFGLGASTSHHFRFERPVTRLYDDILAIAKDYMGIAAEDYIRRRIRIVQQGADPEHITVDRLDRLVAGIEMTAKVYMSVAKAAAFREEVLALKGRHSGDS